MADTESRLHALGRRLVGEQFLVLRAHNDHPDLPDSISVLGDADGLGWHYFDPLGVHRVYSLTIADDAWGIAGHVPQGFWHASQSRSGTTTTR